MAKQNKKEKVIENKIKHYLALNGYYFFKNSGLSMGVEAGRPDVVACIYGLFVAIEVKREKGGVQSEAQKFVEEQITENFGIYLLTNDHEECIKELEKIKEKYHIDF